MKRHTGFSAAVSVLALVVSAPAWGQSTDAADTVAETPQDADDAIVVTGIRRSLERAADIKRDSVQVSMRSSRRTSASFPTRRRRRRSSACPASRCR